MTQHLHNQQHIFTNENLMRKAQEAMGLGKGFYQANSSESPLRKSTLNKTIPTTHRNAKLKIVQDKDLSSLDDHIATNIISLNQHPREH